MKATATTRATTVKGMPTKKSVKQLILQSVAAPKLARVSSGFKTDLGELVVGDCLAVLRNLPDNSVDLVVTSPPYDGQPKYGNGEKYERDWYRGFFMQVTEQVLRVLKPKGSFVLNYRSRRHDGERGVLQYEMIFWLREQGFFFCEDFVWGKPSPPPGRFKRVLKDAV
ncbi:MAG TPA: DNA methyltransferase, partial [Polyangia bacterium]|nr:DNA methyltransferase [Polyangia bacterium]